MALSAALPCFATHHEKKTLKVGFCPLQGFFEYDKNGKECGYGVDVLDEISKYTGYEFEYVHMDEWEDNAPALQTGEIDIFLPVSRPTVPLPDYAWTDQGIIDTYYCLMTLKDTAGLHYEDYKTFVARKELGVEYRETSPAHITGDTPTENCVHCDGTVLRDSVTANEQWCCITDGIVYAQYNCIYRKGENIDPQNCTVAVAKNLLYAEDFLESTYTLENIITLDTFEECMNAVLKGKVDVTIANSYVSNFYLSSYRYNSLTQSPIDSGNELCFAVYGDDGGRIISVFNKILQGFTDQELSEIVMTETSRMPKQNLLEEMIYGSPTTFAAIVVLVIASISVLLFLAVVAYILRKKNKELALATESKERFFSQLSHDIRTPMNGILGTVRLLKDSNEIKDYKEAVNDIEKSGEFMMTLLNDVLDMSKIRDNNFELKPLPYDYAEFEQSIRAIVAPKATEKDITFIMQNIATQTSYILIDKMRVQQIFINLLSNAIKFTPRGGVVTFRIEPIQNENNQQNFRFSVSDTGIGMSEEFLKNKLFQEFEQEITSEGFETGTGLGLAIVKKLVDKMGGTISCESTVGKGTTFVVVLPVKVAEVTRIMNQPITVQVEATLHGRRILLCEDHPMNTKILTKLLAQKEMLVDAAENGQIGLQKFLAAKSGYYDAILMDIRMPVMDGLTATAEIRRSSHPDAKTIPIIAMSANAFLEDAEQSKSAGMNEHLSKPIEPKTLYETLYRYIQNLQSKL